MKRLISCVSLILLGSLTTYADENKRPPSAQEPSPLAIAKLSPQWDGKEVTVKFSVSKLDGVAQLSIPGKAPTFIIEATSEHATKDLTVWIEGELADVLDRLQLSFVGANPLKPGTVLIATGSLSYSPGAGNRTGHEWYTLNVAKWRNFRIVRENRDP